MRNGYRIIDTDCHQMEPASVWTEWIDPRFRESAPQRREIDGRSAMVVEGESIVSEGKYPFSTPAFLAAMARAQQRFARAQKARYDATSRLADMDEYGVDIQVIYPTVGGQILGREFRDPELLLACCRAFNDWSADYCSADPKRLRWAAMLPVQATDLAIEEARRSAEKGCVSFYLRPNPVAGRNLHDEANLPLFEEIERLGLPISIHDSGSPHHPSYGDRMESHTAGHILAHPFEAMSAMAGLIWFGVAERYPKLRIVHVEADAGWAPFWVQRMEQHWAFSRDAEHPHMKMAPLDYFKRNFWVAARGDEMTLASAIDLLGDEHFVFNTDYPHPDGTFPWGIESLEKQPIAEESIRRVFWDNAAEAFLIA